MLLGLVEQRRLQRGEPGDDAVDCVAHPQAEVGGDLVVARARGVQPARRVADQLGQPRLDIHMDVFEGGAELELAGVDLRLDLVEPGDDRVAVLSSTARPRPTSMRAWAREPAMSWA